MKQKKQKINLCLVCRSALIRIPREISGISRGSDGSAGFGVSSPYIIQKETIFCQKCGFKIEVGDDIEWIVNSLCKKCKTIRQFSSFISGNDLLNKLKKGVCDYCGLIYRK